MSLLNDFHFLNEIMQYQNSDRVALVIGKTSFSYKKLIKDAQILAKWINGCVPKNTPCIIVSERTVFFYQAVLACFLAGVIYTPINLSAQGDRNAAILTVMTDGFFLIGDICLSKLQDFSLHMKQKIILVKNKYQYEYLFNAIDPMLLLLFVDKRSSYGLKIPSAKKIAYLLFTSGSTGIPKGVPISYRNINAYLASCIALFCFGKNDRFSQISDIGFDISIHEMLLCWTLGATLYVYDAEYAPSLALFLYENNITHTILIPSQLPLLFKQCKGYKISLIALQSVFVCGEPFPIDYAKSFREIAPHTLIYNLYGPTEATVACFYHLFQFSAAYVGLSTLPIGYPFPGIGFECDDDNQLILMGDQVALTYRYCDNEKSVVFNKKGNTGSYATGDRVSYHAQYGYLFQGRRDDQWKISGYRLEKAEVELYLKRLFSLNELAVVPLKNGNGFVEMLCVFTTALIDIDQASFLNQLSIPNKNIVISFMPRLTNGKIDYGALKVFLNEVSV